MAMSFSVLGMLVGASEGQAWQGNTNAGSMGVMVWPEVAATNSLLMKRPVGCVYLRPLGAFNSIADMAKRV